MTDFVTYELPTHWAIPLLYGDVSGLDDFEIAQIEAFEEYMIQEHNLCICVDISEDTFFIKYHDARPFGVLAGDCATFTFEEG